jgi:hypothetical protein
MVTGRITGVNGVEVERELDEIPLGILWWEIIKPSYRLKNIHKFFVGFTFVSSLGITTMELSELLPIIVTLNIRSIDTL